MKKTAAILFLFVLLFNPCGYSLLINCIQSGKEAKLVTQLDNDAYAEEELITIKTPIALPYYTNTAAYERINGTIEIDGTEYKYVKRRIFNDSLELLCIPNAAKKELETARQNFFKLTNEGVPADGKGGALKGIKNVLLEYCEVLPVYRFTLYVTKGRLLPLAVTAFLPQRFQLPHYHPPETA